jgi:hypothetical protein
MENKAIEDRLAANLWVGGAIFKATVECAQKIKLNKLCGSHQNGSKYETQKQR